MATGNHHLRRGGLKCWKMLSSEKYIEIPPFLRTNLIFFIEFGSKIDPIESSQKICPWSNCHQLPCSHEMFACLLPMKHYHYQICPMIPFTEICYHSNPFDIVYIYTVHYCTHHLITLWSWVRYLGVNGWTAILPNYTFMFVKLYLTISSNIPIATIHMDNV